MVQIKILRRRNSHKTYRKMLSNYLIKADLIDLETLGLKIQYI